MRSQTHPITRRAKMVTPTEAMKAVIFWLLVRSRSGPMVAGNSGAWENHPKKQMKKASQVR